MRYLHNVNIPWLIRGCHYCAAVPLQETEGLKQPRLGYLVAATNIIAKLMLLSIISFC